MSVRNRQRRAVHEAPAEPAARVRVLETLRTFRLEILLCLALAAAVGGVYWPATGYGFVNFGDDLYVYANPIVRGGLTGIGLEWAFTTFSDNYWSPVTYISHMLDVEWFGMEAGKHHRTSLLIHGLNALLVFGLLRAATGSRWRSAIVAALFALHPLRVESAAWIAERKDLLGGFFWLAASIAWVRHRRCSLVVLALFALGLMSKPMLVTLPFVLLLMDYWPLGRFGNADFFSPRLRELVKEKIPLFALSAAVSAITILGQRSVGAIASLAEAPPLMRLENGVLSAVLYLRDTFWPQSLAVLYPYPKSLPPAQVAGAAILILAVTWLAFAKRARTPYVWTGWLWFLGTLAPVSGLIQAGSQSRADRFTYLPAIGLTVCIVWGLAELLGESKRRYLGAALAVLAIVPLAVASRRQLETWRDSTTLFTRALAVTSANAIAHNNLGKALSETGNNREAIAHYRAALDLAPHYAECLNNLGTALAADGQTDTALDVFSAVVKQEPRYGNAHFNRGVILGRKNRAREAEQAFREALRRGIDTHQSALAHYHLGVILNNRGDHKPAIDEFTGALLLEPSFLDARKNLAIALYNTGQTSDAIHNLKRVLRERPADSDAQQKVTYMQDHPAPKR